jgi:propanol-preferring alcohol dehydrogenase
VDAERQAAGTSLAMVLERPGGHLEMRQRAVPEPGPGQVLIGVSACGVCRTDLHLLDAELPGIRYPIVPGHQVVGRVLARGAGVEQPAIGQRIGLPWLGHTCGQCPHCQDGEENLCDSAGFTGYQFDGGYSTHCLAEAAYVLELPEGQDDLAFAPLLCAGLIGYRALKFCGKAKRVGLYGFGAAAHIIAQVAIWQGREIYAFTRRADDAAQALALRLGAYWAGASDQAPPRPLDAAIIFAAAGELVPLALAAVRKGGSVICGGIHMSDIPSFPYERLWGERTLRSVANLTRQDAREFLALAPLVPVRTEVHRYPLRQANEALADLRAGRIQGAAVLDIEACRP